MRRPLIAGNWKLHKNISESLHLVEALKKGMGRNEEAEVVVAPVYTALHPVALSLEGSGIALAAQNCWHEKTGAFTGEVSPPLLRDLGCSYVIVGHSERRQIFGEDDELINRKVRAVLQEGLSPIFCIGETLQEREDGWTFEILKRQVMMGLQGFAVTELEKLVVAYEPVWAIGTGKTATGDQAQEAHAYIRRLLGDLFGDETAQATRILYGGSVKPDNIDPLMAQPDLDGALVGGASLKAEDFLRIIQYRKL